MSVEHLDPSQMGNVCHPEAETAKHPQRAFPTPTQLLNMAREERQKWMQQAFDQAAQMEFETFDAFGEEGF